jgi:DNA-binding XRE family transcriptional regulator
MKTTDLLSALARKLNTNSQNELALALGVTPQTLINWKKRNEELDPNQIASAIAKSKTAAVNRAQYETIRPIVEYYPVAKCPTKRNAGWQVFSATGKATQYARELQCELDKVNGIYIFYDSRGHSLYVGKAKDQKIWKEMNSAFNRERDVQTIKLVDHPDRNQIFKPGYEKLRQPKDTRLELYEMAYYFSAYQVSPGMIDDLEAFMVRGFANDLLNVKMETFAHSA